MAPETEASKIAENLNRTLISAIHGVRELVVLTYREAQTKPEGHPKRKEWNTFFSEFMALYQDVAERLPFTDGCSLTKDQKKP